MTAPALLDPRHVTLDLTYRCPLNCDFCFMAKSSTARRGPELSRGHLGRLVDSLSAAPRRFYLSGGEPLLRPDLPWLVKYIKSRGHYCRVITSLSCGAGALPALLAAGLDELTVSVHGTPAIHDKCVGRPGAFAAIAAACAAVNSSPFRKRSKLVFWCTVNKASHAALHAVYKALAALKPDEIAFHHLDFITAGDLARTNKVLPGRGGPRLKVSQDLAAGISPGRLYAQILKIKGERDPRVRFDLELSRAEMKRWYDPRAKLERNGTCLGLWNGLWIDPSGNLITCQPLGCRLGSALKENCLEAFNGPAYGRFRAALAERGGFLPTCSRCGRAAYMSGRPAGAPKLKPRP
ncbi:MAG TPA: hypothetical protein DEQ38_14355 [Elusimicrobia bacterium]|nr:MAG: hypothetical protein A2089_06930 [Elusimicrobia bacterium GWD2_63_28]HCC49277.1 hypothetical protein [Elusimicrobiota bacterium]